MKASNEIAIAAINAISILVSGSSGIYFYFYVSVTLLASMCVHYLSSGRQILPEVSSMSGGGYGEGREGRLSGSDWISSIRLRAFLTGY